MTYCLLLSKPNLNGWVQVANKRIRHQHTALSISCGEPVDTAIKKGWKLGLQVALAPVLPTWLVSVTTKVLVPILAMYTKTAVNRSIINHKTNKQGRKLKAAASAEDFKKAFYDLARV